MTERKTFKLSDQIIGQIREVLQLSLLTRTHIVDNLRAMEIEESPEHAGTLLLSEGYCTGWNEMVAKMYAEAEEKHAHETSTIAEDEPTEPEQINVQIKLN